MYISPPILLSYISPPLAPPYISPPLDQPESEPTTLFGGGSTPTVPVYTRVYEVSETWLGNVPGQPAEQHTVPLGSHVDLLG